MDEGLISAPADCAPTASAAVLQLAEGAAPLKRTGKQDADAIAGLDTRANASEGSAAVLEAAIRALAAAKNIAIVEDLPARLATNLVETLSAKTIAGIACGEADAAMIAAAAINRLLDVIAAKAMIALIWRMEGFEELEETCLTADAQAWMAQGVAPHIADNRFRWPDPIVMLKDYVAMRGGGRASVIVPNGSRSRVAWFVDGVRCRAASRAEPSLTAFADATEKAHSHSSQPVPQLIRCPYIPGTINFRFPDGRCVKRRADGSAVSTWWRDGQLHRDSRAGPALWITDAAGRVTEEQYFERGMQVERPEPAAPMNRKARRAARKQKKRSAKC